MANNALTLRLTKGEALTYEELDDNFTYLQDLATGNTSVDLSNYYTIGETDSLLNGYYSNTEIDAMFSSLSNIEGNLSVNGDITVTGTIDGRDIALDGTKLDGIESGATADQTGPQIEALLDTEIGSTDWKTGVASSGSNGNGNYVRFTNGTQICDYRGTSSSGGSTTWTFPIAFSSPPQVVATCNQDLARMATTSSGSASAVNYSLWNVAQGRVAAAVSLIAIGRWS